MGNMDWVDSHEEKASEQKSGLFFKIAEGDNRVQLLTHCAPLALKWTGANYIPAQEGDSPVSVKGVCYLYQDGMIKEASLPYTVVKAIRALQNDPDWMFDDFPMPRPINIKAKGAGTKEVEYAVIPSPKENAIPKEILDELSKKPAPEELVEKKKGEATQRAQAPKEEDVPEITAKDIPF